MCEKHGSNGTNTMLFRANRSNILAGAAPHADNHSTSRVTMTDRADRAEWIVELTLGNMFAWSAQSAGLSIHAGLHIAWLGLAIGAVIDRTVRAANRSQLFVMLRT